MLLFALFFLFGCTPAESFDRQAMLESIGLEVVIPQYELLVERTVALESAAATFCAEPSADTLEATRAAFRSAKEPLKMAEPWAFGPYTDSPLRLGPEIDLWPGRAATVDDRLAGTDAVDVAAIEAAGGYAKGFPALDHLLFAYQLEALRDERACTYLRSLTSQIRGVAEELLAAWAPSGGDYIGLFIRGETPFAGVQGSTSVLVEQLIYTLENVRELKIGKPFGKRDSGVVQPEAIEAPDSGRSLQDAEDAVRGTERAYRGAEGEASLGVEDLLLARRPELAPEIDAGFQRVYDAFDAVPGPLAVAITESTTEVEALYQAVKDLQVLFAVDLAQALGVTITFNPTDGD